MFSYGYEISDKKLIKLRGEKEYLFKLNEKTLKELKYNGRLEQANQFNPVSKEEQNVLSRLFFVKSSDIQKRAEKDFDKTVYSEMMKSYFYNNINQVDKLKEKQISFVRNKEEVFLIDSMNKSIINSRELDFHFDKGIQIVDVSDTDKHNNVIEQDISTEEEYILLEALEYIFNQDFGEIEYDRRKKRKKINR